MKAKKSINQKLQKKKGSQQNSMEDCLFCMKFGRQKIWKVDFAPLLNRALFSKYSTTHSKHVEIDIQELIQNSSKKWVIDFKDLVLIQENDEYLKRFYRTSEHRHKLDQLLEYYKYHIDLPRIFMKRISNVANYFYEKKKQIEYKKIKFQLGIPLDDEKTLDEENDKTYNSEQKRANQNLLIGISLQQNKASAKDNQISTHSILKDLVKNIKGDQYQLNISSTWLSMMQPSSHNQSSIYFEQVNQKSVNDIQKKFKRGEALVKQCQKTSQLKQQTDQLFKKQQALKLYTQQPTDISQHKKYLQEQFHAQTNSQELKNSTIQKKNSLLKISLEKKQSLPINMLNSPQRSPMIRIQSQFTMSKETTGREEYPVFKDKEKGLQIQTSKPPIQITDEKNIIMKKVSSVRSQNDIEFKNSLFSKSNHLNETDFKKFLIAQFNCLKQTSKLAQPSMNIPFESLSVKTPIYGNVRTKSQEIPQQQFFNTKIPQNNQLAQQKTQAKKQVNTQTQQSNHRKSQTQYTESSFSPSPKNLVMQMDIQKRQTLQSAKRLTQMISNDIPPSVISFRDKHKHTMSQPSINININQLNMNTLNLQAQRILMNPTNPKQPSHLAPQTKTSLNAKVQLKHLDQYQNSYYHPLIKGQFNVNYYKNLMFKFQNQVKAWTSQQNSKSQHSKK